MSTKQNIQRRGKAFRVWLIYYSIILLMPIVLAVVVYNQAINIISTENKNVHQASLHQLGTQIDAKLYQLRTISTNILLNNKIQKLGELDTVLAAQEYYDMYQARKDIYKYLIIDDLIKNIYIYFNRSGCMLSDSATIKRSDVAPIVADWGYDYDTWQTMMQNRQTENFNVINASQGGQLLYMQSIVLNTNSREPLFTIIIVVNTSEIRNMLDDMQLPPEGAVMVLGENGEFLSSYPNTINVVPDDLASYNSGDRTKDGLVLIEVDSRVSKCKYYQILPYSYYQQKAKYINTIVGVYLLVCLLLGSILVYYFSRHNYLPLEKLKTALAAEEAVINASAMDEFSIFEQKINGLIHKKEQLQQELKDNKGITRNSILFNILKSRQGATYPKMDILVDYGLKFSGNSFSVILFEMESGLEKLLSENDDEEEVFHIAAILIGEVFTEITANRYSAYFIECDEQIAGIINYNQDVMPNEAVRIRNEMLQATSAVIGSIREHYEVTLSAALSNLHEGLEGIRDAYMETQDIFEYKRLKGETSPVMWLGEDGIALQSEYGSRSQFHDTERQFYDLVVNGDYKGAYSLLTNIIAHCNEIGINSLRMMKFRIFGLMNIMLDVLIEIKTPENELFIEKLNPINRLLSANRLAELQSETVLIMDSIVQHFENQDSNIKYKMDEVSRYINHQYYKADLCVQSLSDLFGMSVSYLSRMYKRITGESLLKYIHQVRIDNAKTLLAGGMSIKDVAIEVGYSNSQTLIRAFKRYQGITPGQYKID